MVHLVLTAIAGKSLPESFGRLKKEIPAPDHVFSEWQNIRLETPGVFPCPFSELQVLPDGQPEEACTQLTVVLLGNDELRYPATPQQSEDGPTYADYVEAYCRAAYPTLPIVCEWWDLGFTIDNASAHSAALRSAILDAAGEIHRRYATSDDASKGDSLLAINGVAGAAVAGDALGFAAGSLGWQTWFRPNDGRVHYARHELNSSSLADRWGAGRALVARHDARLNGTAKVFDRDAISAILAEAETEGILAFVAPRPVEGGAFTLGMSRFGAALLHNHVGMGRPLSSGVYRVLARSVDSEAKKLGARLAELLDHWAKSDLFGSNQVSELVAHTESHCEAVDRNVASVAGPLLAAGALSPHDVFHLAIAAWLHDWGHSGATFSRDQALARITEADDIRDTHGLLSAERIRRLLGMSGLTHDEAVIPALIAAHHQGWTSIDTQEPVLKKALQGNHGRTWSLRSDLAEAVERGEVRRADIDRIPLLIALFRVCDAADVGVHRAFYAHVINDRILDEIMLRARREAETCSQFGDLWVSRLRDAVVAYFQDLEDPHPTPLPPLRVEFDRQLLKHYPREEAVFKEVEDWARHCIEQVEYFRHHQYVLSVHLAMEPRSDGWELVPYVEPVDDVSWREAHLAVATDIHRELGDEVKTKADGGLMSKGSDQWKATVKELLNEAGISVGFPAQVA